MGSPGRDRDGEGRFSPSPLSFPRLLGRNRTWCPLPTEGPSTPAPQASPAQSASLPISWYKDPCLVSRAVGRRGEGTSTFMSSSQQCFHWPVGGSDRHQGTGCRRVRGKSPAGSGPKHIQSSCLPLGCPIRCSGTTRDHSRPASCCLPCSWQFSSGAL